MSSLLQINDNYGFVNLTRAVAAVAELFLEQTDRLR